MDYLEQMNRSTEWDYVALVAAIEPKISHVGESCPAEPMWYIIKAGLDAFPESEILARLLRADGQGRACESGEIHYAAKRWLKEHDVPDRLVGGKLYRKTDEGWAVVDETLDAHDTPAG